MRGQNVSAAKLYKNLVWVSLLKKFDSNSWTANAKINWCKRRPSLKTCRNTHFRNRKMATPLGWVQQRLTKTAKDAAQTIYCPITVDDSGIIRFGHVYRFNDRLGYTGSTIISKWNIRFYWKRNRLNNVRVFTCLLDRLNMHVCSTQYIAYNPFLYI